MEDKAKKRLQVNVGLRVWQCREQMGMSREQLAERLGISPQYVSDIERGKKCMSMAIFVELGRVFRLDLEYLAYGKLPEDPGLDRLNRYLREMAPVDRESLSRLLLLASRAMAELAPEEE